MRRQSEQLHLVAFSGAEGRVSQEGSPIWNYADLVVVFAGAVSLVAVS